MTLNLVKEGTSKCSIYVSILKSFIFLIVQFVINIRAVVMLSVHVTL